MNVEVAPSSGNVFADLGLPDPDEHRRKAWIVVHIGLRMKAEGLTQPQAAKRMGVKVPDLSAVLNGRFRDYSVEQLWRCLSAFDG